MLSERYRHAHLLAALVLLVVLRPFLGSATSALGLIDVFLVASLVSAVVTCSASVRQRVAVSCLGILVATTRLAAAQDVDWAYYAFLASTCAFAFVVAAILLGHIVRRTQRITADTLYGAVSAYLLLGIAWACMFAMLQKAHPGSFDFGARIIGERDVWGFIGFSFTTLTTLGYGNIAPLTERADALATSEAIVGQFYIAVLVSRLIGLQISQGKSSPAAQ